MRLGEVRFGQTMKLFRQHERGRDKLEISVGRRQQTQLGAGGVLEGYLRSPILPARGGDGGVGIERCLEQQRFTIGQLHNHCLVRAAPSRGDILGSLSDGMICNLRLRSRH